MFKVLYQPQSVGYTQLTEKFKVLYQPPECKGTQLIEKFKVLYQPQGVGYTINRKVQGAVSTTEGRVHN